jgi:hypothetical protein
LFKDLRDGGRHASNTRAVAAYKMPISIDRDFARMASPIVVRVAADACLLHVRKLAPSEMEALIYCILRHFSLWTEQDASPQLHRQQPSNTGRSGSPSPESDGEIQHIDVCVALIQNVCFVRSIPLFEASGLIYAIRDCVIEEFRLERLRAGSDGESEGEEEAGSRFFDLLVFELLKGY